MGARSTFAVCLLLACTVAGASDAPLLAALLAPLPAQSAGATVPVELVLLNPGTEAVPAAVPAPLPAVLSDGTREWSLLLQAADDGVDGSIAPGEFVRRRFSLPLPADAVGLLVLTSGAPVSARGTLTVLSAADAGAGEGESPARPALDAQALEPVLARVERDEIARFGLHEPIYFIYGPEKPAAKFQFSLKYRLLGSRIEGPRQPPRRALYLAYTQRTLWDIGAKSSPFYDTSYMPELFFESLAAGSPRWLHWLGYQAGLKHESNGRAGAESRSLNTAFARSGISLGRPDGWMLLLGARVQGYLGSTLYTRGYTEFDGAFGRGDGLAVRATARPGRRWDKGNFQVDASYPLHLEPAGFKIRLYAQLFDGYGESLLAYDERSTAWRAGFSVAP